MAAVVVVNDIYKISKDNKLFRVYGTITPSGSYATGGDTLNFASGTWPIGQGPIPSNSVPVLVSIMSQPATGGTVSGYVYGYATGTDMTNGKFQLFQSAGSAAPLAQVGAGAYPAGVTGDVIVFEAIFKAL